MSTAAEAEAFEPTLLWMKTVWWSTTKEHGTELAVQGRTVVDEKALSISMLGETTGALFDDQMIYVMVYYFLLLNSTDNAFSLDGLTSSLVTTCNDRFRQDAILPIDFLGRQH
jgi:hypothetical protein